MTEQDVFNRLREHLHNLPVGFPETESGVEIRILKRLFTEEEAEMAIQLSPYAATAEEIAERIRQDPEDVKSLLDQMSTKGLIFNSRKGGISTYRAAWFIVGIFEYQVNRLTKEFAEDFDQYLDDGLRDELLSYDTHQLRVVPVNQAIDAVKRVASYDDARELIRQQSKISIQNCICRQKKDLQGAPCSRHEEREVCLAFSSGAYYFLEHGLGREISQEEALERLDFAEQKGLVMSPGNAQKTFVMCLCCGDCCEYLGVLKTYSKPSSLVNSNYYAQVDIDLCSGCETCVDRCQMEAITIVDDISTINLDRCIGCGLCVTSCPEEAMSLEVKTEHVVPPADIGDLYMKIGKERLQKHSS
ncbi:MAG: 4Fe-4S binding protein [Candidatus Heimdallarchaeota archaeon]|nr:MAG: 4Fe-4S binding protein [Candidatus Heimdallarchaeota archaeon]